MDRERCIVCNRLMGNSLNKLQGKPVHLRCEKDFYLGGYNG